MEPINLTVNPRTQTGKSAARIFRADGSFPAVLYGAGKEAIHILVKPEDLEDALDTPYRRNTLLSLNLDGEQHLAVIKEVQKHPVSKQIQHVDFYAVSLDQVVEYKVPLVTTGKSKGVQLGGHLFQLYRTVKLSCKPAEVPETVELDITSLDINDKLSVSDLPAIDGVTYLQRDNVVLIQVKSGRGADLEDEEAEGADEAEGAEGADAEAAGQES